MIKKRIIPCLLLENEVLVKTEKFKNPKYVGDPLNAIKIFNTKEVDELMVLDINASKTKQEPNFELIEQFASECFMPLTYGGGIRTIDQASRIFKLGVEKICIQSKAIEDLDFVTKLSDRFGSQSVVVSIDVQRNWMNKPKLYNSVIAGSSNFKWLEFIKNAVISGAGEILLNSVDKDGTFKGPDLELIKLASLEISTPLIYCGGIGSIKDFNESFIAGASAVAAGSFFVFYGPHKAVLITYPSQEEFTCVFN